MIHEFLFSSFIFTWSIHFYVTFFFFRIINIKISQGSFSWFHLCSRFTQWLYITFHTWFLHVIRLFSHMIFYTQLRIFFVFYVSFILTCTVIFKQATFIFTCDFYPMIHLFLRDPVSHIWHSHDVTFPFSGLFPRFFFSSNF